MRVGRPHVLYLLKRLRAALPFALTMMVTLMCMVLLLPLLDQRPTLVVPMIQLNVPTSAPTTVLPPGTASPTVPVPPATPLPATATRVVFPTDTVSFELSRLQTEINVTNGYVLLLKAAGRLQSARLALRDNDLPQVSSQLVVAQEDLDRAAQLLPEPLKGTVQVLISDINYLLDDISVRPELIDSRLVELWERISALVEVQTP